jgi:pyruvyltransferase
MLDHEESVGGARVVRWNPERPDEQTGAVTPVNNFGDLLGPLIVDRLLQRIPGAVAQDGTPRLLGLGSVLHLAEDGDVVWGTGVNGKMPLTQITAGNLDIRAVRGPRTRAILQSLGHSVPETYGDPALLLPELFPETAEWAANKTRAVTVIPNFNDFDPNDDDPRVVSPRAELWSIIRAIAESELVVGSSLHAIIVAEALGVPARVCLSEHENYLKYVDYFAGTGRTRVHLARNAAEAIALGGVPRGETDLHALLASFPADLWTGYQPRSPVPSVASVEDRGREWARELVTLADLGWEAQAYDDDAPAQLETLFATRLVQPLFHDGVSMAPETFRTVVDAGAMFLREYLPVTTTDDATRALLEAGLRDGDRSTIRRLLVLRQRGVMAEVRAVEADDDALVLSGLLHLGRPDASPGFARLRLVSEPDGAVLELPGVQVSPQSEDGSVSGWSVRIPLVTLQDLPESLWNATLVVTGTQPEEVRARLRAGGAMAPVDLGWANGTDIHAECTAEGFFSVRRAPTLPEGSAQ